MDLKRKLIILGLIVVILISAAYVGLSVIKQNNTFIDKGTSDNKNTEWICNNNSIVQISGNGTTINNTSPNNVAYSARSGDYWAEKPFNVEFDVIGVMGNPYIHIFDGNNSFKGYLASANNSHVKIQVKQNITWFIGDKMQTPFNQSMGKCYIRFLVPQNTSITYTNFKIMPIQS